jgi:hypothetical protein
MVDGMYYFHFLSYIQIVWVYMVEPTRKGMQVLNHLVFYKIMWVCAYSVYFLVIPTPIHGIIFVLRNYIVNML